MISESVSFIRSYEDFRGKSTNNGKDLVWKIEEISNKYPKIIIINAYFDGGMFKYEGFDFLVSNIDEEFMGIEVKDIRKWLNNREDIVSKLDFNKYINAMSEKNKMIGSTSGLMSFSLFHFNLRYIFDSGGLFAGYKKIKAFKLSKEDLLKSFQNEENMDIYNIIKILNDENGVRKIYREFLDDFFTNSGIDVNYFEQFKILSQKDKNKLSNQEKEILKKVKEFQKLSQDVYIYLDINGIERDIVDRFRNSFLSNKLFLKQKNTDKKQKCPICGKMTKDIGFPSPFNALGEAKKPFNKHYGRPDIYNTYICKECTVKLNDFEQFLKKYRIDFFPLFIDKKYQQEEINYLKQRNNKKLSFFDILEHIYSMSKKELDFILLHRKNDILYYDYINNYDIKLGKSKKYLSPNESKFKLDTLKNLKNEFEKRYFMNLKPNYFFGTKNIKMETYKKYLLFKYREKIFDLIYRNKKTLTDRDLAEIISTILDSRIREGITPFPSKKGPKIEKELLDLYLNSPLFIKNPRNFVRQNGGVNMLEHIRKENEKIVSGEIRPKIDSDEKFAYYLGQVVYYLISKSESKNKMNLLTPLIGCQSNKALQRVVTEKYFDKYVYKLSDDKDFEHLIFSEVLDYLNSHLTASFSQIKVPFYVGFFDDNIFLGQHRR